MSSIDYISAGANRQPFASDYNVSRNLIVYGSNRLITLWNHSLEKVISTVKGHNNTVTVVRFINDNYLISGSVDSTIKLWSIDSDYNVKCINTITDHRKTITSIEVNGDIIVSGSSDGSFIIWKFVDECLISIFNKSIGPRFYPNCLAIEKLEDNYIIAVGGTANDIYIFTGNEGSSFNLDAKLFGHENWIRSLSFKRFEDDILLASSSQDNYIRLWRIHSGEINTIHNRTVEDEDENANTLNELATATGVSLLSNKVYHINNNKYTITFEALLMGHDDWIYQVSWHPTKLELLSGSSDSTLMFWSPDESSGIWICSVRLGDVSIKGASTATGASGGFWNALWLDDGKSVATIGRTGSWRIWNLKDEKWISKVGLSGHTREVTDLSWEDSGSYLLSTSLDQTTRLHSKWKNDSLWHEMSRPQIHGYDMITVKSLNKEIFVSAGDEKTIRVFEQPKGIAELLEHISNIKLSEEEKEKLPESATVPLLGLSNKQEDTNITNDNTEEDDNNNTTNEPHVSIKSTLVSLDEPPKEDHLQRQTLWPELEKLYGHGYEISSIDINSTKTILATCCKANNETHAVIRLYDIKKWLQIKPPLSLHNLTITRLRFSPDGNYLLSVSRDRQWGLFNKSENSYQPLTSNPKGHSRIIWDCSWLPNNDGFVTASRDKSIKLWKKISENEWKDISQIKFDSPVTAIDINNSGQTIIGLETGELFIYQYNDDSVQPFTLIQKINETISPALRITRISWRPNNNQFAVASEDFALRIYNL